MVDLAEIQTAYYMAAATGVIVAAIYYVISLRYNMKAREMEICRLHTSDYTSDQGLQRLAIVMNLEWKDYKDFMEKYGFSNPDVFGKWSSQFFMWETMGLLVKSGVVKADKLYNLGGYGAIWIWEKYKDIIQNRRDTAWGQDYMSNFEFYAQEMLKIKMSRDASFKDKLEATRRAMKF